MTRPKLAGPGAASRKYDLLSALGSYALARDKHTQRTILRLMTLITARYNWQRDEFAVGQRELAQLWSCNERTVKREMARLRALGWIVVKRAGARGRVTRHGLDLARILDATRADWGNVGPDLAGRLAAPDTADVVPLPLSGSPPAPPDAAEGSEWALAQNLLHAEAPALYGAWLHALSRAGRAGGQLVLRAPSRFHAAYIEAHLRARVLHAVQAIDDSVTDIVISQ